MPPLAVRPWFIVALLGLFALSPVRAGMTPEEVKAFERYKVKAEKGGREDQYNLAYSYFNGNGVAKNFVQAAAWYRKAAEQGDAEAQFYMALFYCYGFGVAKDEVEAYAYWNLAGITHEPSRNMLGVLEKRMSPDARLLGQQRTKQLHKEIEGRLETIQDLRKAAEKESLRKGA
jgi:TPR repeat protein